MNWWTVLGSWLTLAMAIAALLFSVACFHMIRAILHYILQFDPQSHIQIKEIHAALFPKGKVNDDQN